MFAPSANPKRIAEDVAATLTEAALPVVQRHGVASSSVDVELGLWHALSGALRARRGGTVPPAAVLADAAYQAVLGLHPRGAFVDLELDLWQTFRAARRHHRPGALRVALAS